MTAAATLFAKSQRTLTDLRALAEQSGPEAEHYLREVAERLRAAAAGGRPAQAIDQLLAAAGPLTERIAARAAELGTVFAPAPDQWGALQAARAATLGWSADGQVPVSLAGTVRREGGQYLFDAPGLRTLRLAEGAANEPLNGIPGQWVAGLMDDGPVQLKGTLGADGLTFNVEAFALNRDGRYTHFTSGRVVAVGSDLYFNTTRNQRVELTDPALRAQVQRLNRLALILPGEPRRDGDKLVYDASPERFFALARFNNLVTQPHATVEMAHQVFVNKPAVLAPGTEGRVNHRWRVWLEGRFTPGATAQPPTQFNVDYVSKMADSAAAEVWLEVPLLPRVPDASVVDAARELSAP